MPISALERIPVKSEDLRRMQEKLVTFANAVTRIELLHGRRVMGVTLTGAAETKVEHKLGRTPLGWFLIGAFGAIGIPYESTTRDDKFLYLTQAGATAVVDLWVF